jgi:hypothetical protein
MVYLLKDNNDFCGDMGITVKKDLLIRVQKTIDEHKSLKDFMKDYEQVTFSDNIKPFNLLDHHVYFYKSNRNKDLKNVIGHYWDIWLLLVTTSDGKFKSHFEIRLGNNKLIWKSDEFIKKQETEPSIEDTIKSIIEKGF